MTVWWCTSCAVGCRIHGGKYRFKDIGPFTNPVFIQHVKSIFHCMMLPLGVICFVIYRGSAAPVWQKLVHKNVCRLCPWNGFHNRRAQCWVYPGDEGRNDSLGSVICKVSGTWYGHGKLTEAAQNCEDVLFAFENWHHDEICVDKFKCLQWWMYQFGCLP